MKKTWITPELLVLVRHNPEEAVLIGCKTSGNSGPGSFCSNDGFAGIQPPCNGPAGS